MPVIVLVIGIVVVRRENHITSKRNESRISNRRSNNRNRGNRLVVVVGSASNNLR